MPKKGVSRGRIMERSSVVASVFALLVCFLFAFWSSPAFPGDYHSVATNSLVCSDCHSMHASSGTIYVGAGPYQKLLKASTSLSLCLYCHDGSNASAPDVNNSSYMSAAGWYQPNGVVTEGNRHSIGGTFTPGQIPGYTGGSSITLVCISCHNPHGFNTAGQGYRNLRTDPGTATGVTVTYSSNTYVAGTAIFQAVFNTSPRTALSTHFNVSNIQYRQSLSGSNYGLQFFCAGCHGNFHGAGGAANMGGSVTGDTSSPTWGQSPWIRHPTRDVTLANGVTNGHIDGQTGVSNWFSALTSRIPVISPSGTIPGTSGASDNVPFCGSCHKVHGSVDKSMLILDNPATALVGRWDPSTKTVETTPRAPVLVDTCEQCHYQ